MKQFYIAPKLGIFALITALVLGGLLLYQSLLVTPKIAEIGSESAKACLTSVTTFSMQGICDKTKVKIVSFTCANGTGSGIDGVEKCIDPIEAYNYAKEFCGKTCPEPSPSPSNCTPETGSCLNSSNQCVQYNNVCQKNELCASPYRPCGTPILPRVSPSPRNCAQVAGSCEDASGVCKTYTDGCQMNALCKMPLISCGAPKPSLTPAPPVCAQVAGKCVNNNGSCSVYKDGCEMNALCKQPYENCGVSVDESGRRCITFFGRKICLPVGYNPE